MFSIIWMIILGYIIFKVVRQKREDNGGTNRTAGGAPTGNAPAGNPPVHTGQRFNKQAQQPQRQVQQRQTQQQSQQQSQQSQASQQGSTMAYLEEKAKQDEIEHAREKQEEARRLHQNYGGLRAAERLYEGDSVPNGKRCVVCAYCGAENLLPMVAREKYSCYFCREPLR